MSTPLLVLVYGAVLGVAQGTRGAISGSAYAHYFGRTYIGSIKGFVATLTVAGTAVGPLLFALGDERFGGYREILLLFGAPALGRSLRRAISQARFVVTGRCVSWGG